jgi:kynurenine formamidase
MIGTATEGWGADYFALAPHGFATSHIDALCHIFYDGKLFNGYATETVTAHGATRLGIHHLRNGIVTRGVLLDVPAGRGVDALEPGDPIFPEDLETAEERAGLRVGVGDALLIRTGRWRWRDEHGPWDFAACAAGLDASCLAWLRERDVATLGSDGVSDVLPSRVEGVGMPIHEIAIVALGLHLMDNLDLDALAAACAAESRWEFLFVVAPLVLRRGTASPVNPLAVF